MIEDLTGLNSTKGRNSAKPTVEVLEARLTPAVTANVSGGVLTVTGDASANNIEVLQTDAGALYVTNNGIVVLIGGTDAVVPGGGITQINVNAGDGNDTVTIEAGITTRASINGEGGDDTLTGGAGRDTIKGGTGNDSIQGGGNGDSILGEGGNDTLRGGDGQDTIEGGNDNDDIDGEAGDDLLFGDDGADTINDLTFLSILGGAGRDTINGVADP